MKIFDIVACRKRSINFNQDTMETLMNTVMNNARTTEYPIENIFLDRWSPRAYEAQSMPDADLRTILEAARWAPSAFNIQPWRFLYSHRDDAHWETFLGVLDSFNQSWAGNASALIIVLSDTIAPGSEDGSRPPSPLRSHSFDAGASWAQLALQSTALGYQAHAMAGIDFEKPRTELSVPENFQVEIAIAIGKRAEPSNLPEGLRERELPSQRLGIDEIAFAGSFPGRS